MSGLVVLDILAMCLRVLAGVYVMTRLLHLIPPQGREWLAAIIGAGVLCTVLAVLPMPDYYAVILEAALLAFCVHRWQSCRWRLSLFVAFFYTLATALWRFILAAWLAVCFHSLQFLDGTTLQGLAAGGLFHVALAVLVLYIWKNRSAHAEKR